MEKSTAKTVIFARKKWLNLKGDKGDKKIETLRNSNIRKIRYFGPNFGILNVEKVGREEGAFQIMQVAGGNRDRE